jgi:hypothetical protein
VGVVVGVVVAVVVVVAAAAVDDDDERSVNLHQDLYLPWPKSQSFPPWPWRQASTESKQRESGKKRMESPTRDLVAVGLFWLWKRKKKKRKKKKKKGHQIHQSPKTTV